MSKIELGGNIELDGFDELDKSQLVVLKKIIGNYAKEFSEKVKFGKLIVSMSKEGELYKVTVELAGEKILKSELKDKTLFFVLGNVLENLKKEL